MFTGLVEAVGQLIERAPTEGGYRLRIAAPLASELALGDSLAVNGVCLTVVHRDSGEVHADVGPETVRVTTLGSLPHGARLNLERPLRADSRLGGHFVQGHVDGVGRVRSLEPEGDGAKLTLDVPPDLLRYCAEKGSLAVDGVSLTIAALDDQGVEIALVPHTLAVTTLASLRPGATVNLEVDVLAKYVERLSQR